MFSMNTASPSGLTASLKCRSYKKIRKPQPSLRVMCGSHNGSTTAYPASVPDAKRRETEKALVVERDPTRVLTLGERMRFGRLLKDRFAYKESFVVRSFEVGSNKAATMETMLNLILETSYNHAQSWGWAKEGEFPTLPSMDKYRLSWTNYQMHVEMNKYPGWGDVVEIEHWCEAEGKIAGRFDYIIKLLSTNEVIGRATSKWVMINKDTHKPQKINKQVWDEYLAFCSKTSRLAFPEDSDKSLKQIPKLNEPAEYSQLGLVPRRSDLNMNGHVNSVTCFSFLLESMPQDIIDNYELGSITIDYRHNFQFDDSLDSNTSSEVETEALNELSDCSCLLDFNPNDGKHCQFLHSLKLSRTRQETNRGRTTWRKH
ncbi:hypothetical protein LUZ63_011835 [Rhynchospora breviuscula]|uniref:Acyl-[acyl-carrier-protein] hydrolase n=1 Tax=Rhynchospora breviuscula TaxID=2022672 RepID=A0A9Q0CK45_9POAL|nr:hypothetical protein LUZ63_011835 [Rhynchospora breviuscula]